MLAQPGCNAQSYSQLSPSYLGMDDLTTVSSNDSLAKWVIAAHSLLFVMLCVAFCTTRQRQTNGRLVQELNVPTVEVRYKNNFQK